MSNIDDRCEVLEKCECFSPEKKKFQIFTVQWKLINRITKNLRKRSVTDMDYKINPIVFSKYQYSDKIKLSFQLILTSLKVKRLQLSTRKN